MSFIQNLVIIDRAVEDYQGLMNGILPNTDVLILNPTEDGIEQITHALQKYRDRVSLHIVSHGSPGCLYLGSTQLSIDTIDFYYADQIKTWSVASLLLYGCNVALGDAGSEFIDRLNWLTNADIAASARRTGNAALDGDWMLEVTTSDFQPALAFRSETLQSYASVLVLPPAIDLDGDNSSGGTGNNYQTVFAPLSGGVSITDLNDSANEGRDTVITDADNTQLSSATITLTNAQTNDQLIVGTLPPGITASTSSSGGQIIVTLSGNANLLDYEAALEAIKFNNTSATPNINNRAINVQVTDTDGQTSTVATNTVAIQVGNVLIATQLGVAPTVTGGTGVGKTALWTNVANVNGTQLNLRATVTNIASGSAPNFGTTQSDATISTASAGTFSLKWELINAVTGAPIIANVGFTVNDIDGNVNAPQTPPVLEIEAIAADLDDITSYTINNPTNLATNTSGRTITFYGTADQSSEPTSQVRFNWLNRSSFNASYSATAGGRVFRHDGNLEFTFTSPVTIGTPRLDLDNSNVATVNDFLTTFFVGKGAIGIADTDTLISDADSTNLQKVTIVLTNAQAGDVMSIAGALPVGITSAIDTSVAGKITVTLTGVSSLANYEAAVEAVRFNNPNASPATVNRIFQSTATDHTGNLSSTATTTVSIVTDNTPPTLTSSNPADNATGVAVGSNLILNFSETIQRGTGNIVLRRVSDGSIIETFDAAISPRLIISGNQLIIDPTSNLASETDYYVEVANTAIKDLANNAYAGINDSTTLNFKSADIIPPTSDIIDVTPDPRNNNTGLVTIDFTENVTGVDLTDFALTRNGSPVSLSGVVVTQVNGSQYTIDLSSVTGADGTYVLNLNANGTIKDLAGNALITGSSDSFIVDAIAPTADIIDVTPDPRNSNTGLVTIDFTENVSGVNISDFTLTRDGNPVNISGLTVTQVSGSKYTIDLSSVTGTEGNYVLSLNASGSGIQDGVGNLFSTSVNDTFVVDTTIPTVDIVDVTPDPRNTNAGVVTVTLSEDVTGVDIGDFTLTRDGNPVNISGLTVTQVNGSQYTIDLSSVTGTQGTYVLSLNASGSGIQDGVGNALTVGSSDSFVVDVTAPTADIIDVTPDPRNSNSGVVTIDFSENVSGVNIADFTLTRDGNSVDISGLTLTQVSGSKYTIDLSSVTATQGNYVLTLNASGSGIQDSAGNLLAASVNDSFVVDTTIPTSDIVDVTPDPRNSNSGVVTVNFSENVTGVDITDFTLTKDGNPVNISGFSVTPVSGSQYTIDLSSVTGGQGTYVLSLNPNGTIKDIAGNALITGSSDSFVVDAIAPTADIIDVTPDPRNSNTGLVTIDFTENVSGVDITDFTLTRDGNPVNISGLTVTQVSGSKYTIDLSSVTGTQGNYVLSLNASGSGIQDGVGNLFSTSVNDTFVVDTTIPTADIVDVTPDPRNSNAGTVIVNFTENVSGVDVTDFILTRDGNPVNISGLTVTPISGSQYSIDLSSVTGTDGTYLLSLNPNNTIKDTAGNALTVGSSDSFTVDLTIPTVDIVDITPDPRNTNAGVVTVTLSENVTGVDISDFNLTRDGNPVNISGLTITPISGSQYTIDLSSVTGTDGTYLLSLNPNNTIKDTAGNVLTVGSSDSFIVDTTVPTADIVDVTPDPRNTNAGIVTVNFAENVSGVNISDFTLIKNGVPIDISGLTVTQVNGSQYTIDLSSVTTGDGNYVLSLNPDGTIVDAAGNPLATTFTDSFTVDTTVPTADIVDITPDPRNSNAGVVTVNFSENVSGVDISDFALTVDGNPVDISGLSVTPVNGSQYTIDLSSVTGVSGNYLLTLNPNNSIVDAAGNAIATTITEQFTVDTTVPTVDIVDVTPDPRNSNAGAVTVNFGEDVTGVGIGDFTLTLNGNPVDISGLTVIPINGSQYTIDLSSVTGANGNYVLSLNGSGSGIVDAAGNAISATITEQFTVDITAPTVDIIDVTPDPRNTNAGNVIVNFSENVTGVDINDFILTLDGNPINISSLVVTPVSGSQYSIDLSSVTAAPGTYILALNPNGSILDTAGNALTIGSSDNFVVDTSIPTADIVDITPDPRNSNAGIITVNFSENVSGVDITDFSLTKDGVSVDISGLTITPVNGSQYTIDLSSVTGADGNYVLSLNANNSIVDAAGNAIATTITDNFTVDTTAPTVDIIDVTPDPRNTNAGNVIVNFSENVSGIDISDFTLTLDGNPVDISGLVVTPISGSQYSIDLSSVTGGQGNYLLSLNPNSSILDATGNALTIGSSDSFTVDTTVPTADIVDVTPDPRNTNAGIVTVNFTENVSGVDIADFTLTKDGTPVDISGLTVTQINGSQYTIDLSSVTGGDGNYVLSLNPNGSILDAAGNAIATTITDNFTVDITAPTVDIVDVTPDPRNTNAGIVTVNFDEDVTGVDITDFTLTRDGVPIDLTGLNVTSVSGSQYSIDLLSVTSGDGNYVLTLNANNSIVDAAGNAIAATITDSFTVDTTVPTVDIVDVTPDPRNSNAGIVTVTLSENVTGVDISDFNLTRDGVSVDISGLSVTQVSGSQYTIDLSTVTGVQGNYVLALNPNGTILDTAGNALTVGSNDSFVVDTTIPMADIVDVTPDPRAINAGIVTVNFTENVTGVDISDFTLTVDGNPVDISGLTVTPISGSQYSIDLSSVTATGGNYVLALNPNGTILDTAGNALTIGSNDSFVVDTTIPTADIVDITPDPRNTNAGIVTVNFAENVSGVDISDFTLVKDGIAVDISGLTVTQVNGSQYTIDLSSVTGADGNYVLSLNPNGTIVDAVGNFLATTFTDSFTVDTFLPMVDIVDVTPDPRNSNTGAVIVNFSEDVSGVDISDFTLALDGNPVDISGLSVTQVSGSQYGIDLSSVTATGGNYVLALNPNGTILDTAGNALTIGSNDSFVVDTTAPTADIVDITPDPRNGNAGIVAITLSETVTGLDISDLTLTKDGVAVDISALSVTPISGSQYSIDLSSVTGGDGNYVLSLNPNGSVLDTAGNAVVTVASDSFTVDGTLPTADIVDITPDPRNSNAGIVTVNFSENVTGVDISDFTLTKDGVSVDISGLTVTPIGGSQYTIDLSSVTGADGNYVLSLNASGSDIVDAAGNAIAASINESFTVDTTLPTVDIVDITPDPRNSNAGAVIVNFSENVSGVDISDFTLTVDGNPVDISGLTVTPISGSQYSIDLSSVTGGQGNYVLALNPNGTILDTAGNALTVGGSDGFTVDTTVPTADIVDVTPDPRNTNAGVVTINFSENVTGVDISDFTLTVDGNPVDISGLPVTQVNGSQYTIDLSSVTGGDGNYVLSLNNNGTIVDAAGNAVSATFTDSFTVDTTLPTVDIVDVTPDPRNTNAGTVIVNFSENVAGVDISDFILTLDGTPVDLTGLVVTPISGSQYSIDLSSVTGTQGTYLLSLNPNGSIVDAAGNALATSVSDGFIVDTTPPTADIIDVDPDPRNNNTGLVTVTFTKNVTGVDISDFTLTLDGNPVDISGLSVTQVNGSQYTIDLSSVTAAQGNYVLNLNASGSNIQDILGNALVTNSSDSFLVDPNLLIGDIVNISPDPRNTDTGIVTVNFNQNVTGVDISDFTLTRDGASVDISGLSVTQVSGSQYTIDLSSVTGGEGNYVLSLNPSGSGIQDTNSNPLLYGNSDSFTVDLTAPTADIVDISPDPRNNNAGTIIVNFSEDVSGVDISDFTLTRDGTPVDLTGLTITPISASDYAIDLSSVTATGGTYVLSINNNGTILDAAGNAIATIVNDTFVVDTIAPTVDIVDITPDPRNSNVGVVTLNFTENVTGVDINDFTLTVDGNPVDISGLSVTQVSGSQYTIDLSSVTAAPGNYVLNLNASGSGILDSVGNAIATGANDSFTVDLAVPTADIIDITPDPRNTNAGTVIVNFSEDVTGVDISDFTLTIDGNPVDISGLTVTQISGSLYSIDLSSVTGTGGNYVLALNNDGTILDTAGNAITTSVSDSFTVDLNALTADITDISPDPRNTNSGIATVTFNKDVTGVDIDDFTLTVDGNPVDISGLSITQVSGSQYTIDLSSVTGTQGTYVLTLNASGSGIQDAASNPLSADASDSFVVDLTLPTVDIVDVTPDPRGSNAGTIIVNFSEDVTGVDITDFTLTIDGNPVDISGLTVTPINGSQYSIDLSSVTGTGGNYVLSLNPNGSILDTAGNILATSNSDSFTIDTTIPTADIVDVTPDPRNINAGIATVNFSENVSGVDITDFSLTRDGVTVDISGLIVTPVNGSQYTIDLSSVTGTDGNYVLSVNPNGSIVDLAGNAIATTFNDSFTIDTTAPVADIVDISPDPRNSNAGIVTVGFGENVSGVDISDFTLTVDGNPVDISGLSVTQVSGSQYTIDLSSVTGAPGNYVLSLNPNGSILDTAGNVLNVGGSDSFSVDLTVPTGDIVDVTPDPRNINTGIVTVNFSEDVTGVDISDFALTRDGVSVDISGLTVTPISGSQYGIDLSSVTAAGGTYVLSVNPNGTIKDTAGNLLTISFNDSFVVDPNLLVADIVDISPDPRNSNSGIVTVNFNKDVTGVDISDFTLTRDGVPVDISGLAVTQVSGSQYAIDLSSVTGTQGSYVLTLNASGSGIQDLANNPLSANVSDSFIVDLTVPTADIVDISPDPRNSNAGIVTLNFSENVTGVDINDFTLTKDGVPVDLTGLTVTPISGSQYSIDLSSVTAAPGTYALTLNASGTGIQDAAGNAIATGTNDSFIVDTTIPTADIVDVTPDPRNTNAGVLTVTFTKDVNGVDISDFTLTRDGVAIDISSLVVNPVSSSQYTIDLSSVTGTQGAYVLALNAGGSGIQDAAGNLLATNISDSFIVDTTPPIAPTINSQLTNSSLPILTGTWDNSPGNSLTVSINGVTYTAGDGNLIVAPGSNQWTLVVPASNPLGAGTYDAIATVTDSAGNAIGDSTVNEISIDTTIPVIVASNPADNSIDIAPNSNLVLTFSEAIQPGTGAIVLYDSNGNPIQIFNVAGDPSLSFNGNTLTINPTNDLNGGTGYYLQIANGAINDLAGNAFTGISDSTTLNFTTVNAIDTDGDGIPNAIDLDNDNDGIPDAIEQNSNPNRDSDGDGIIDSFDLDSDNDGITDTIEAGGTDSNGDGRIDSFVDSNSNGIADGVETTPLAAGDRDGDGVKDFQDLDSDNDGITDTTEAGGTDANGDGRIDGFVDSNGDGVADRVDPATGGTPLSATDRDGDGVRDFRDLDSDGDGRFDLVEVGGTDSNGDGKVDSFVDANGNGLADSLDPAAGGVPLDVNRDSDGNGLPDRIDGGDFDKDGVPNPIDLDDDNDGIADTVEQNGNPTKDTDGDGIPDSFDRDSDNDGITDTIEAGGTDNNGDGVIDGYIDSNGNGIADGVETNPLAISDSDGDGVRDFQDSDSDNDGITDTKEAGGIDANGDGIIDGFVDSNSDGITDRVTPATGGTPLSLPDSDGDGVRDFRDRDSDNDGITDAIEAGGIDANGDGIIDGFVDSNGDGLADNVETTPLSAPDTDGDGVPNYQDLDSDGDGIFDILEVGGTDSNGDGKIDNFADSNGDGLANSIDPKSGGTPLNVNLDSDGNGIPDRIDSGDYDKDGIVDINDLDDDNDGIPDAVEQNGNPNRDSDGDGIPDSFDLDSDNDGITDTIEAGGTDSNGDGQIDNFVDSNSNGIADSVETNPLPAPDSDGDGVRDIQDLDSDNDGIADLVEAGGKDTNGDGKIDNFVDANGNGLADSIDPAAGGTPLPVADSDGDGVADYRDRDSDNDGISDVAETGGIDDNKDGIADRFIDKNGDGLADSLTPAAPIDSDSDGIPDFKDTDSDGDGRFDVVEVGGTDTNGDGRLDNPTDSNGDGLADSVDPKSGGTPLPILDSNGNGIPDYKDPASRAVQAVNDRGKTRPNTPILLDVLTNDLAATNDILTIIAFTQGVSGLVTLNDNGTPSDPSDDFFSYTPNPNFTGNDSFTYTVRDSQGNQSTATVTVAVRIPSPANDDSTATLPNEPISIRVLDNDGKGLRISGVGNGAHGTVTINDNGTPNNPSDDFLVYTPDPNFEGQDEFQYTAVDTNGKTYTASVSVMVDPIEPFAADDAIATAPGTDVFINVLGNDKDPNKQSLRIVSTTPGLRGTTTIDDNGTPGDTSDDRILYAPNDLGDSVFSINRAGNKGLFSIGGKLKSFTDTFSYTVADPDGNQSSATVDVTVDPQVRLKFTLTGNQAGYVNEVGFFYVDDENGSINGFAPGQDGYIEAALSEGRVIFSSLSQTTQLFGDNPTRILDGFRSDQLLNFFLVQNSTVDEVLAKIRSGQASADVFFATAQANESSFNHLEVGDVGTGGFSLSWEDRTGGGDRDFNDVALNVQVTDEAAPIGNNFQGGSQGELFDVTQYSGQTLQAQLSITQSGAYNNIIGLYRIEDASGSVRDPISGALIAPGQAGYADAAIAQTVAKFDKSMSSGTATLEGGSFYAPYLLSNGTQAFFPFIGSNSDGIDHLRLLADNTFGFEDLPNGGDLDYNDIVIKVAINPV